MSKLLNVLKEKYGDDPKNVLKVLGLDASLLSDIRSTENSTMTKPTKFANFALQMASAAIKPLLAKDAKIDLMPVFRDVTAKTFDAKKVRMALDGALKGKLAKDAEPNMGHVATMLDHIGSMAKPEVADAAASPEEQKMMEAAAGGESSMAPPPPPSGKDAPPPEFKDFLKSKNMSEDDINAACDMLFKKTGMDESPEDKAKREEEEKKKAEDMKAKDAAIEEEKKKAEDALKAKDAEIGKMVTKDEMNSAIAAAVAATKTADAAKQRALADVKPIVGDLAMSFDSAEAVYRHVGKMKGVPGIDTVPAAALQTIVGLLPRAGARPPAASEKIAMDAAAVNGFDAMFPDASKIGTGTV